MTTERVRRKSIMENKVDPYKPVVIRGTVYTGSFLQGTICKVCAYKNAKKALRDLREYAHDFALVRVEDALTNEAIEL